MSTSPSGTISTEKCRWILNVAKVSSPGIVLLVFLLAFIVYGLATAPNESDKVEVEPKGPGGRPLPRRRKSALQIKEAVCTTGFSPNAKLIFNWLSVLILASFAINALEIILETLLYRGAQWWPGQAAVVSQTLARHLSAILIVGRYTSLPLSSSGPSFYCRWSIASLPRQSLIW